MTKHIEKQQRADNFLDRIRTSEPLEKRQNVGRAKQKSTQKDQTSATTTLAGLTKKPGTLNKS